MDHAYDVAATAVKERFAQHKPEFADALKNVKPGFVTVVSGVHDHVHNIVKKLGVPFEMNKMNGSKIVFINCGHDIGRNADSLRAAVENGATLVTSDWALTGVVSKTFPKTIKHNGKSSGDEVVSVEPTGDSLWSDLVVPGADPQWWLESASYPIEILDEEKVKVEAASWDMMVKFGAPEVAVSFPWGKGSVFHVVSHFYCRRSQVVSKLHSTSSENYMKLGMKLSDESLKKLQPKTQGINFAQMQTAATSTELVAQLIARAVLGM